MKKSNKFSAYLFGTTQICGEYKEYDDNAGFCLDYDLDIDDGGFISSVDVVDLKPATLAVECITKFRKLSEEQYERLCYKLHGRNLGEYEGYSVIEEDGILIFGCGEVKLTRKEIEDYVSVVSEIQKLTNRKSAKIRNFENVRSYFQSHVGSNWIDVDLKEIQYLLK